MSFLGDIVSSIGGEKAPAPPIKPPSRPSSTKPQSTASGAAQSHSTIKPVYRGTAGTPSAQQTNGMKRKADEALSNEPHKSNRPLSSSGITANSGSKPAAVDSTASTTKGTGHASLMSSSTAVKTPTTPTKPAGKGSYAEMLLKAKQAAQQKAPSQIGVIKHQATEKVKVSKVAERMRGEQEKPKPDKNKSAQKAGFNTKSDPRRRSASPVKGGEPQKQAKGPRPPLHAPAPQYRGTMGTASKKSRDDRDKKKRRYDEYLGTDEEDEDDSEGYGDGQDDYYSDVSSDMEGGFDEVEQEERKALREAQMDDAKELALEQRLKKEKLERKQKLEAMASKRK